jgi:H+-transporting ATPase
MHTDDQALNTFCFEILLFLALFSIFVVREKKHFWNSAPSKTLLCLIIADMILGMILSTFGLLGFKAIPLRETIAVIAYTAVFSFLVNDAIKFILFKKWPYGNQGISRNPEPVKL